MMLLITAKTSFVLLVVVAGDCHDCSEDCSANRSRTNQRGRLLIFSPTGGETIVPYAPKIVLMGPRDGPALR